MKVSIALELREREALDKICYTDPCASISCGGIECDSCPLHSAVVAYNEARLNLREVVAEMGTIKSEEK